MAQSKNILTNKLLGKEGQSYREHRGGDGAINTASSYSYVGRVLFFLLRYCGLEPSGAAKFVACAAANGDSNVFPSQRIACSNGPSVDPSICVRT
jgi:hypothetical protein